MRKRMFFSLILFAILPVFPILAATYSGGDGSAGNPYQISEPNDWKELINTSSDWSKNFILTSDLDFFGAALTPIAPDTINETNYQFEGTPFSGVLNGNGHIIRNAVIDQPNNDFVGLFGYLAGQIIGLGVENITISGRDYVGGLCGNNGGSIRQSYDKSSIIGSWSVGGLCGYNSSTIRQCYANGSVASSYYVGSVCGNNGGTILQCYGNGLVTGSNYVGGLCGWTWGKVIDCYWDIDASGQIISDGGWGLTSVEIKQAANYLGWDDGNWTIDEGVDSPRLGWENRPGCVITTEQPLPTYSGSGTEMDPFQIANATDLICLSRRTSDCSSHFILMNNIDLRDFSFSTALIAYGSYFSGVFNGNNHVIKHLNITGKNKLGLFSRLGSHGLVTDLGIENCVIQGVYYIGGLCGANDSSTINRCHATGTVTGELNIGCLCGWNYGGTINQCYSTGSVKGVKYIGGLSGANTLNGLISRCYSDNTVMSDSSWVGGLCGENNSSTISHCYAIGSVTGKSYVGGLVGRLYGSSAKIENSYSIGQVTATTYKGGLLGELRSGIVTACFWDKNTSGMTTSAGGSGIVGKTTAQLKTRSTFTAAPALWDFIDETTNGTADIWRMCVDGVDYPHLTWEYVRNGDFECLDGINVEDLGRLSADWLTIYSNSFYGADANGDQIVNIADFTILAENWLAGD
jgi:hypothetical protein